MENAVHRLGIHTCYTGVYRRRHHTSKLTVAANCILIWTIVGLAMIGMGSIFSKYVLGSAIALVVALASYFYGESLSELVCEISHVCYSSKTVLGVTLAASLAPLESYWLEEKRRQASHIHMPLRRHPFRRKLSSIPERREAPVSCL